MRADALRGNEARRVIGIQIFNAGTENKLPIAGKSPVESTAVENISISGDGSRHNGLAYPDNGWLTLLHVLGGKTFNHRWAAEGRRLHFDRRITGPQSTDKQVPKNAAK